jgi:hypothetical protein
VPIFTLVYAGCPQLLAKIQHYNLLFTWLNLGYALPAGSGWLGMYGVGLCAFALAAALSGLNGVSP